jgi:hypothetical protein
MFDSALSFFSFLVDNPTLSIDRKRWTPSHGWEIAFLGQFIHNRTEVVILIQAPYLKCHDPPMCSMTFCVMDVTLSSFSNHNSGSDSVLTLLVDATVESCIHDVNIHIVGIANTIL